MGREVSLGETECILEPAWNILMSKKKSARLIGKGANSRGPYTTQSVLGRRSKIVEYLIQLINITGEA